MAVRVTVGDRDGVGEVVKVDRMVTEPVGVLLGLALNVGDGVALAVRVYVGEALKVGLMVKVGYTGRLVALGS